MNRNARKGRNSPQKGKSGSKEAQESKQGRMIKAFDLLKSKLDQLPKNALREEQQLYSTQSLSFLTKSHPESPKHSHFCIFNGDSLIKVSLKTGKSKVFPIQDYNAITCTRGFMFSPTKALIWTPKTRNGSLFYEFDVKTCELTLHKDKEIKERIIKMPRNGMSSYIKQAAIKHFDVSLLDALTPIRLRRNVNFNLNPVVDRGGTRLAVLTAAIDVGAGQGQQNQQDGQVGDGSQNQQGGGQNDQNNREDDQNQQNPVVEEQEEEGVSPEIRALSGIDLRSTRSFGFLRVVEEASLDFQPQNQTIKSPKTSKKYVMLAMIKVQFIVEENNNLLLRELNSMLSTRNVYSDQKEKERELNDDSAAPQGAANPFNLPNNGENDQEGLQQTPRRNQNPRLLRRRRGGIFDSRGSPPRPKSCIITFYKYTLETRKIEYFFKTLIWLTSDYEAKNLKIFTDTNRARTVNLLFYGFPTKYSCDDRYFLLYRINLDTKKIFQKYRLDIRIFRPGQGLRIGRMTQMDRFLSRSRLLYCDAFYAVFESPDCYFAVFFGSRRTMVVYKNKDYANFPSQFFGGFNMTKYHKLELVSMVAVPKKPEDESEDSWRANFVRKMEIASGKVLEPLAPYFSQEEADKPQKGEKDQKDGSDTSEFGQKRPKTEILKYKIFEKICFIFTQFRRPWFVFDFLNHSSLQTLPQFEAEALKGCYKIVKKGSSTKNTMLALAHLGTGKLIFKLWKDQFLIPSNSSVEDIPDKKGLSNHYFVHLAYFQPQNIENKAIEDATPDGKVNSWSKNTILGARERPRVKKLTKKGIFLVVKDYFDFETKTFTSLKFASFDYPGPERRINVTDDFDYTFFNKNRSKRFIPIYQVPVEQNRFWYLDTYKRKLYMTKYDLGGEGIRILIYFDDKLNCAFQTHDCGLEMARALQNSGEGRMIAEEVDPKLNKRVITVLKLTTEYDGFGANLRAIGSENEDDGSAYVKLDKEGMKENGMEIEEPENPQNLENTKNAQKDNKNDRDEPEEHTTLIDDQTGWLYTPGNKPNHTLPHISKVIMRGDGGERKRKHKLSYYFQHPTDNVYYFREQLGSATNVNAEGSQTLINYHLSTETEATEFHVGHDYWYQQGHNHTLYRENYIEHLGVHFYNVKTGHNATLGFLKKRSLQGLTLFSDEWKVFFATFKQEEKSEVFTEDGGLDGGIEGRMEPRRGLDAQKTPYFYFNLLTPKSGFFNICRVNALTDEGEVVRQFSTKNTPIGIYVGNENHAYKLINENFFYDFQTSKMIRRSYREDLMRVMRLVSATNTDMAKIADLKEFCLELINAAPGFKKLIFEEIRLHEVLALVDDDELTFLYLYSFRSMLMDYLPDGRFGCRRWKDEVKRSFENARKGHKIESFLDAVKLIYY